MSRDMRAPPDAVWEVMTDLRRLPDWLDFASTLEDVSGDTVAEGATYTVKPKGSFEPKTHWRIAEVEPPRRQVHTSEMPMISAVTSTIEVTPSDGDRSNVRVRWRGEPSNLVGRMMRPMFQRQIQGNWERSLERLDEIASGSG